VDAGRPSSGVLQTIRLACKAKYKLGIRNAYSLFEKWEKCNTKATITQ